MYFNLLTKTKMKNTTKRILARVAKKIEYIFNILIHIILISSFSIILYVSFMNNGGL